MPSHMKKSFAAEQLKLRKKTNPAVWILLIVAGIVVVISAYVLYTRFGEEEPTAEIQEINSIAVLPFRDMSPEKNQDYFCEGITDEILNALTKVRSLHVPARTSSFGCNSFVNQSIISVFGLTCRRCNVPYELIAADIPENNFVAVLPPIPSAIARDIFPATQIPLPKNSLNRPQKSCFSVAPV